MKKIVVVHHSNQLGLGGTEKDMQIFCKYLDKNQFEVHALTRQYPVPPHRFWMDTLGSFFGIQKARDRKMRYAFIKSRVPEFAKILGEENVHFYTLRTLPKILKKISPRILHVHHNGETEPPLDQTEAIKNIPILFTINGFGFSGKSPHQERITRILFPSFWVKECAAPWSKNDSRCGVLYCPIEKPYTDKDLRAQLGIGKNIFVVGRVGRNADDIHDEISLRAYKEIENGQTLFLALAPPQKMKKDAQELGIKNILNLEPSVDNVFLSQFYNTIDCLAHARLDGETFGCVIAEAMIHGKPVVTHRSDIRNAQVELVSPQPPLPPSTSLLPEGEGLRMRDRVRGQLDSDTCGFVVDQHDWQSYAQYLKLLMENKNLRLRIGESAKKRALENFEAELITKKLEALYFEELSKRNIKFE